MDYATLQGYRKRIPGFGGRATEVVHRDGEAAVRFHRTEVLIFREDGSVRLDSGGWRTPTTKNRIRDFLPGYGWTVAQDGGQWWLYPTSGDWEDRKAKRLPFADGVTIYPDGRVEGAGSPDAAVEAKALRKRIKVYAAGYVRALAAGDVPAPSGGDCWGCLFQEDGKPEAFPMLGADHLREHLTERYYVPSLLVRAVKVLPVSPAARNWIAARWDPSATEADRAPGWADGVATNQIRKALARFLFQSLGLAR